MLFRSDDPREILLVLRSTVGDYLAGVDNKEDLSTVIDVVDRYFEHSTEPCP